jgi:hypothetical protein
MSNPLLPKLACEIDRVLDALGVIDYRNGNLFRKSVMLGRLRVYRTYWGNGGTLTTCILDGDNILSGLYGKPLGRLKEQVELAVRLIRRSLVLDDLASV